MDRRRQSYASVVGGTSGALGSLPAGLFDHIPDLPDAPRYRSAFHPTTATERPPSGYPFLEDTSKSKQALWEKGGSAHTSWQEMDEPPEVSLRRMTIRPSYLAGSKYLERLDAQYKARLAKHREHKTPSLSRSASTNSLPRMEPSHRGMTYEIVEYAPPDTGDDLTPPLPSKWSERDKNGGLELTSNTELKFASSHRGHDQEVAAARSDYPMPRRCGIYYYEVTIYSKPKDSLVAIGFSTQKATLEKLPGAESESWGYHGDEGKCYGGSSIGKSYGPPMSVEDVIGCGIDFAAGRAFFTRNGGFLDYAFTDLKEVLRNKKVFASVGMKRPGAHVQANFGQAPFAFDIDGHVRAEKKAVRDKVTRSSLRSLHPTYNEPELIAELVSQYLRHDGFIQTADSFANEVAQEAACLRQDSRPNYPRNFKHDPHAMQRQRELLASYKTVKLMSIEIRSAVLAGNIDEALAITQTHYPSVFETNPTILFHLKCRKFIEMMRFSPSSSQAGAARGIRKAKSRSDMEVDGIIGSLLEDSGHTTSAAAIQFERAREYGQELRAEYQTHDSKVTDTLNEIFALFAYADPQNSPAAWLMDATGRLSVAEGLNSAILVSLGGPSKTALELIYEQTQGLLEDNIEHGGSGALINLEQNLDRSYDSLPQYR